MKYRPYIVQNSDEGHSSEFHLEKSALFNENDDLEICLRKISACMAHYDIDKAERDGTSIFCNTMLL